jgi:TolB-like protein
MVVSTALDWAMRRARGLLPFPVVGRTARRWPGPLLLALSLICGLPAAASPAARRVAVLEFQGRAIDDEARMTLSDAVRSGVLEASRGRDLLVMTRENMAAMLKEMGKPDCSEGDCEVETARNIGADYVLSGEIARIEGTYVVVLKLHECDDGRLLSTATARGKTQLDLIDPLRERGMDLVKANVGVPPLSPQERPRPPAPVAAVPAASPNGDAVWTSSSGGPDEPQPSSTVRIVRIGEMAAVSTTMPQSGYPVGMPTDRDLPYVPTDVSRDMNILVQSANTTPLAAYDSSGERRGTAATAGEEPGVSRRVYRSMPAPAGRVPMAAAPARAQLRARAWATVPPIGRAVPAQRLAEPRSASMPPVATVRAAAAPLRAGSRGRR